MYKRVKAKNQDDKYNFIEYIDKKSKILKFILNRI